MKCPRCSHSINQHDGAGCIPCPCGRSPEDIAGMALEAAQSSSPALETSQPANGILHDIEALLGDLEPSPGLDWVLVKAGDRIAILLWSYSPALETVETVEKTKIASAGSTWSPTKDWA